MRGHNSLCIIRTSKDSKWESKEAETLYGGHLSAIYVIIEVSPSHTWMCPLHTISPDIKTLPRQSSIQSPPPSHWDWAHDDDGRRFHHRPPSSVSTYKDISNDVSVWKELFVSHKYYKSSVGYVIHSVVIFKILFVCTGGGVGGLHNYLKRPEVQHEEQQKQWEVNLSCIFSPLPSLFIHLCTPPPPFNRLNWVVVHDTSGNFKLRPLMDTRE